MGQNIKSCDFRKYDYGRLNNKKLYGNEQPPQYNLTNIRAPVHIYYGYGDNFATVEVRVNFCKLFKHACVVKFTKIGCIFADFHIGYGHDKKRTSSRYAQRIVPSPVETFQ